MIAIAAQGSWIVSLLRSLRNSGTLWIAIEAVTSRGTLLAVLAIAARILGPTSYGELTAVQGTIGLLSAFVGDALRITAAKHVASAVAKERGNVIGLVAVTALIAGIVLGAIMLVASPILANAIFGAPDLSSALQIGALILFLECLGGMQVGILIGLRQFRAQAISGLGSGIALIPCVVVGANYGGVVGTLGGLLIGSSVGSVLRIWQIVSVTRSAKLTIPLRLNSAGLKILWSFSLPAVLNSLTWAPVNWIGMTMLANSPNGYLQLGILGAATQWFSVLLFLPNVLANAMLPVLAEAATNSSGEMLRRLLKNGLRTYFAIVLPVVFGVILASPLLIHFYGPEYQGGHITLALTAVAAIPAAALNFLSYILAALDRMWNSLLSGGAFAIGYLVTAWLCIHHNMGANAIALAMIVGYSIKLCAQWVAIQAAQNSLEVQRP